MLAPDRGFNARACCPICQSDSLNNHLILDGIRTATCAKCGFMFARDVRSPSEIDQFYVDGYHDKRHMDGQKVNAKVNVDLLHMFALDLSGKSLLDIGSGYGFFLNALRGKGAQRLVGIELSQAQRRYSVGELRVETYGQIGDLSEGDEFDIVTIFEVIEHISQPYEFISAACKHLKVGGSLIIGTDNFTSDVVKVLGEKFPKWIPHEHISFFTPISLKSLLMKSGRWKLAGARSFTPWELLLRKFLFEATRGRKGGKSYNFRSETDVPGIRGFRFFPLRLMANRLWFNFTNKPDLEGEMMYIHAVKSQPRPL